MSVVTMKQLLEAGVHFGHQTRRWNPKMDEYIYTSRGGIHIVDLQKTVVKFEEAYSKLQVIAQNGGKMLFVGTKKQARDVVRAEAERSGQYYVTQRWLGGTLTNFKTIRKSIRKLHDLYRKEKDGTFDRLTKKEVIGLRKEMDRLEKFLSGIKDMRTLPEAVFVVDPMHDKNAVLEARKLGIPVFAIVDTNCDPDMVDVVIPGNDDAIRSIKLISGTLANAFLEAAGGNVDQTAGDSKPEVKKDSKPEVKKESKPQVKKESKPVEKKEQPKPQVKKESKPVEKKEQPKPQPQKEEPKKPETKKVVVKAAKEETKAPDKKDVPKEDVTADKVDLDSMTVVELKELAKERGMTGYSKLRKAELIEALK